MAWKLMTLKTLKNAIRHKNDKKYPEKITN